MNNSNFPPDVCFDFPITHYGIALGNGTLQLSVYGDDSLCLTIARVGFGDDCDGEPIQDDARAPLEAGNEEDLQERIANWVEKSVRVGCAHLELRFADDARPTMGTLQADGTLRIAFDDGRVVTIECAMDEEIAWIEGASDARWHLRSSWEENREAMEKRGIAAPLEIEIADGRGLIQELHADDSLAMMVREREQILLVATAVGETEDAAKAAVTLARGKPDINPIYHWKQYWRMAPRVAWPNERLQKWWNIALFKQGQRGVTPDSIAAFTELLVQSQSDGIHVMPVVPRSWRGLSFDNVRCEGGFIVGADVKDGAVSEVRVKSEKGGLLRLHSRAGELIEREMKAGEEWVWQM